MTLYERVMKTHICEKCGAIAYWDSYFQAIRCTRNDCDWMIKPNSTHAEAIRVMSDEQMALYFKEAFICPYFGYPHNRCANEDPIICYKCWLNWLKKESKT